MLKILPIKKSKEFQKIGKSKKVEKFYSKTLILLSHPTPSNYFQDLTKDKKAKDFCRVGYTVAKTVSKSAVVRNRAKRRLREVFRVLALEYAKNQKDYVIIARKEIIESDYKKIFADLKFCLKRIHNSQKSKSNKNKNDAKSN